jgi:hypothetical protein
MYVSHSRAVSLLQALQPGRTWRQLGKDLFNLGNKAVRTAIEQTEGLYFITFTNCYNVVYKWFGYLDKNKHNIKGYVIMPNHLHVIIEFSKADKKINAIVSNGKRFMAYEMINKLQQQSAFKIG